MLARLPGAYNFSFYHAMVFHKGGLSSAARVMIGSLDVLERLPLRIVTLLHHHQLLLALTLTTTIHHHTYVRATYACVVQYRRRHCLLAPSFHKFKHNPIF